MSQPPQDKLGKYTLTRHLATGGMAEIWLAEQEGPGGFKKQLVIKRVLPHLTQDKQFTQMFLDEARLVAQLTHSNIGQIYELGELDGCYFIAMEYIEGLDGSKIIEALQERDQRLPIGLAVYFTVQVLQALEYAHDFVDRAGVFVGLVHRDVTPHNVIVSNDGVIKLVDFGVAKAKENRSKTQTGAVKGKFAYMAPEQISSVDDPDRRVDVFAVGVMLFEMLTGVKPFGEDLAAVNAILTEPTPDPRALRADVPQTLVNILELALAKDREQRYQGAQAFMDDLQEFMRASGLRGSQRALAAFVRELQGLEMTHSWQTQSLGGPRARITEREQALPLDSANSPSHVAAKSELSGPALIPHALTPPAPPPLGDHEPPAAGAAAAPTPKSASLGLVALFAAVIMGIVVAASVAFYLFAGGDSGAVKPSAPELPKEQAEPSKQASPAPKVSSAERADLSALHHDDGGFVVLHAEERLRVYYNGTYVGNTDLETTLRPGQYKLELEPVEGLSQGERRRKQTIRVKERGFQQLDLSPL